MLFLRDMLVSISIGIHENNLKIFDIHYLTLKLMTLSVFQKATAMQQKAECQKLCFIPKQPCRRI